jgi:hypothetical protein
MNSSPRNLDGYGAPPIEWSRVKAVLDEQLSQAPGTGGPRRYTVWLTTVNADGSPHPTVVGVAKRDGIWYFTSGPASRKSRNLDRDPRCTLGVATEPFDLVIEGTAERVTDADELARIAEVYVDFGWPAEVEGAAFTAPFMAPSAGPPPWYLYRVNATTVYALGTEEPFGATRFQLT